MDNGISSLEGVAEARRLGIDVLVTDHHLPGRELPAAACIVNPNAPGNRFASKALAGVGVAFYVMAALTRHLQRLGEVARHGSQSPATWLDLVALGTVADVVPLDLNNRILVAQGLRRIRAGRCVAGLRDVARGRRARAGGRYRAGPRLPGGAAAQCGGTARRHDARHPLPADRRSRRGARHGLELARLNTDRSELEAKMQLEALAQVDALVAALAGGELPAGLCRP